MILRSKNTISDEARMNYAVVFTYSFNDDVAVYLFEDLESAEKFLVDNYREELRVDVQENGYITSSYITNDHRYAAITDHFEDHDDITEMYIGQIYDPEN